MIQAGAWGEEMTRKAIEAKKSAKPKASKAAKIFMNLVSRFSYQQGPQPKKRGLTNFTFFAGAGFSKSWDPKAPIGSELFTLKPDVIERVADVGALARLCCTNPVRDSSRESSMVAGRHEQTDTSDLQDQELAGL